MRMMTEVIRNKNYLLSNRFGLPTRREVPTPGATIAYIFIQPENVVFWAYFGATMTILEFRRLYPDFAIGLILPIHEGIGIPRGGLDWRRVILPVVEEGIG